ncbi:MAG TPA: CdaR family protein [Bryobacteraceae bacterium]
MTRNWIWRRLTHNFFWKLASLMLAVLLWFVIAGEPELVAIQSVPVLYRNLPGSLLLLSDAPDQVRVELRGSSGRLTQATLADAFAAVDLAGVVAPGDQTFTLSNSDFNLPQGVRFVRAVPSQVHLRFDRILSKAVPVELELKGQLPAGYLLSAESIEPETLSVSGPAASVSAIRSAQTDPIDLSALSQTTELKVNAFVPEPRAQFDSPPVVTVRLTIEKSEKIQ